MTEEIRTRKIEPNQIVILGLKFSVTANDIYKAFSKYGKVTSCRLMIDDHNESKGFCFLSYKNREDAEKCIKSMNGKRFEGKILTINWVIEKDRKEEE